ncbi:MAG: hypothetical protein JNJ58_01745 [Chitinophagaceae bacterium]|nr:hypothetical protein [Chitinophagaceae bacterium]
MSNSFTTEPLEEDEVAFLTRRYEAESRQYMRVMNVFLVLCATVPFIVALVYYIVTADVQVLIKVYFIGLGFLLVFFSVAAWLTYRFRLQKLRLDMKHKLKTIEKTTIASTRFVPHSHTWHFYIHSLTKYSIEVSEADFHLFGPGDEINIEYAAYSREYFGYF